MVETLYKITSDKVENKILLALVSDLHNFPAKDAIASLKRRKPDLILMPGDIFDTDVNGVKPVQEESLALVEAAASIAPSYLSIGNHEWSPTPELRRAVEARGAVLLDDDTAYYYVKHNRFVIGGLNSPCYRFGEYSRWETPAPNLAYVEEFTREKGFKILLSHHPEFYPTYLKGKKIDLIVSGHAHGGQVRLFGQGLFAPGQGILPKLTDGIHDDKLVVSRGLGNGVHLPRLFNPYEVCYISIEPKKENSGNLKNSFRV